MFVWMMMKPWIILTEAPEGHFEEESGHGQESQRSELWQEQTHSHIVVNLSQNKTP